MGVFKKKYKCILINLILVGLSFSITPCFLFLLFCSSLVKLLVFKKNLLIEFFFSFTISYVKNYTCHCRTCDVHTSSVYVYTIFCFILFEADTPVLNSSFKLKFILTFAHLTRGLLSFFNL
jgi:hypothetical protein